MNIISPKVHGVLDYFVAVLLIASPWLFDFHYGGAETTVPVVLGISTILYSLFTAYELSPIKLISFRAHLLLDAISGLLLIAAPYLFDFSDRVFWPHVIFGVLEISVVILTRRHISTEVR